MAVLRLKEGDRVVSCYSWSDLDPRLDKTMTCWHPDMSSRNGRTGTIKELKRNHFGRIEHVVIEWDIADPDRTKHIIYACPTYNPRIDEWPLSLAIRYLQPIEHCNTCKYRVARLAEGRCVKRKYTMNHEAFVKKWRERLKGQADDQ